MLQQALDFLWAAVDVPDPIATGDMFRGRPGLRHLQDSGVLVQTSTARYAVCPQCVQDHCEEVITLADADGNHRLCIACPQFGQVEIDPEELSLWSIDFNRLSSAVAAAFGLENEVSVIHPRRVWKLGSLTLASRKRDLYLARGLTWDDAEAVIGGLQLKNSAVMLVLGSMRRIPWVNVVKPHLFAAGEYLNFRPGAIYEVFEADVNSLEEQIRVVEVDGCLAENAGSPAKRASRTAKIELLEKSLIRFICDSVQQYNTARREGGDFDFPYRPSQQLLAEMTGLNKWDVSRCLSDPSAQKLKILWQTAADPKAILRYR